MGGHAAPGPAVARPLSVRYHDEVWGTRTYDESAMFESLTLGVFEVGSAGRSYSVNEGRAPKGIPRL